MVAASAACLLAWAAGPGRGAAGAVVASSRLELCDKTRAGPDAAAELDCEEALVVTLTIPSGHSLATEQLEATVACVGDNGGAECPCRCNYAADPHCGCRDLEERLTISITKGAVHATYPLYYAGDVNGRPVEKVVYTGTGRAHRRCKDGDLEDEPTCGWYTDPATGRRVEASQGFCCHCSAADVIKDTVHSSAASSRSNLDCNFFQNGFTSPASAHCLYLHPTWYKVYSVGESTLDFALAVHLNRTGAAAPATHVPVEVGPRRPRARSPDGAVAVELLGDLAGFAALPVLSEKFLMVPHPPDLSLARIFSTNEDEWLLVDRSEVDPAGGGCDQIGVGFDAFRYQEQRCQRPVGSCLKDQALDLVEADRARVAAGSTPRHFITRWRGGRKDQVYREEDHLRLRLPVTTLQHSVVSLRLDAASVRLVGHLSPGAIEDARVCSFAGDACGGFEALADRGYLRVAVRNLGHLDADYMVGVANCSRGVDAEPAKLASVARGRAEELEFLLHVADDRQDDDRHCWVHLSDARMATIDERRVTFFTNATQYVQGVLTPDAVKGQGDEVNEPEAPLTCRAFCPRLYDVPCHIFKRCWRRLGEFALVVLVLLLALRLVWACCCRRWRRPARHPPHPPATTSRWRPPPPKRPSRDGAERSLSYFFTRSPPELLRPELYYAAGPSKPAEAAAPPPPGAAAPPPVPNAV